MIFEDDDRKNKENMIPSAAVHEDKKKITKSGHFRKHFKISSNVTISR